ncbi:hypothetical protein ACFX2H_006538 [Malus domestica]|uniref:Uncharacterized protein n=1 Tax=Malus domestica TaxID=3750 RepID=A0A498IJM9_MALDO|nr:hypothetical protein DVH24_005819 [Malus domestica]
MPMSILGWPGDQLGLGPNLSAGLEWKAWVLAYQAEEHGLNAQVMKPSVCWRASSSRPEGKARGFVPARAPEGNLMWANVGSVEALDFNCCLLCHLLYASLIFPAEIQSGDSTCFDEFETKKGAFGTQTGQDGTGRDGTERRGGRWDAKTPKIFLVEHPVPPIFGAPNAGWNASSRSVPSRPTYQTHPKSNYCSLEDSIVDSPRGLPPCWKCSKDIEGFELLDLRGLCKNLVSICRCRSAAIAAAERWGAAGLGHGLQERVVKRTDVHRNLGLAEAWGFVMVAVEKWRRD